MNPISVFRGTARIHASGTTFLADITLHAWIQDGLERWGGFLKTSVMNADVIMFADSPALELDRVIYPFTPAPRSGPGHLRIIGHGQVPPVTQMRPSSENA